MALSTIRTISFDEALAQVKEGAAFVDLRPASAFLDVHIPGSISLVYEFGPGMAGRARDCIPLSVPLVLIRSDDANMLHAAASLRGKGFNVVGEVDDALNLWANTQGKLASTDLAEGPVPPTSQPVLDVGDHGRRRYESAIDLPLERLWGRSGELRGEKSITILAGKGLRAGLAIGILERVGVEPRLWRNVDRPGDGSGRQERL